jgi:hypothetical protein
MSGHAADLSHITMMRDGMLIADLGAPVRGIEDHQGLPAAA